MPFVNLSFMSFYDAFQRLVIQVGWLHPEVRRLQDLRAKPHPEKPPGAHAVVAEEAQRTERSCSQNDDPAQRFEAYIRAEQKVQRHSDTDGQQRKNELPHGQSEKHGFRIVSDFTVNLDFQRDTSFVWV